MSHDPLAPPSAAAQALALAAAGESERAAETLRSAIGAAGGHRPVFEALIGLARPTPAALARAEGLMLALAKAPEQSAMRRDLAALFRANRRWELLDALGEQMPDEGLTPAGAARFRQGDHAGARALLLRRLAAHPEDAEALLHLGLIAREWSDPEQAEAYFRRAVAAAPAPGRAHAELGLMRWHHDDDAGALPLLEAAVSVFPGDLRLNGYLASTYAALGRSEALVPLFRRTLEAGAPWDARILAPARELQGEPELARAFFTALAEFLGAPWADACRTRAAEGHPLDAQALAGAPEPWASLLGMPGRRRSTLLMLLRDEAPGLAGFLGALRDRPDELIAVDAGVSDDAVAVARAHGATIIEAPWQEDYSALRNVGLAHATGDWIVVLPGGTYAPGTTSQRVIPRLLQGDATDEQGRLRLISVPLVEHAGDAVRGRHPVIFAIPNDPDLRYADPLYERLVDRRVPRRRFQSVHCPEVVAHRFMDFEAQRRALPRDRAILLKQLEAQPDSPVWWYYWGFHLRSEGQLAESSQALEKSLALFGASRHVLAHCAHVVLAGNLLQQGELPALLAACERGLAAFPEDPDLLASSGIGRLLTGQAAHAAVPLERAIAQAGSPASPVAYAAYAGWLSELALALTAWKLGDQAGCDRLLAQAWAHADMPDEAWKRLRGFCQALGAPEALAEHLLVRVGARA